MNSVHRRDVVIQLQDGARGLKFYSSSTKRAWGRFVVAQLPPTIEEGVLKLFSGLNGDRDM